MPVLPRFAAGGGALVRVVNAVSDYAAVADGGANTTQYVKESGTGNTGWIAK